MAGRSPMGADRPRRRTSARRAVRAVWSRRRALCQIGIAVGGGENSAGPKPDRIGCGVPCCVCSTPAIPGPVRTGRGTGLGEAVPRWDAPPPRAEQRGTKAGPNRMAADVPASFRRDPPGQRGCGRRLILGRPAAPCGTACDQSGSESDAAACAGFVPARSAGTTWVRAPSHPGTPRRRARNSVGPKRVRIGWRRMCRLRSCRSRTRCRG